MREWRLANPVLGNSEHPGRQAQHLGALFPLGHLLLQEEITKKLRGQPAPSSFARLRGPKLESGAHQRRGGPVTPILGKALKDCTLRLGELEITRFCQARAQLPMSLMLQMD